MIKILLICNCLYGGGSERVFCLLANYLFAQRYQVKIITFKAGPRNPLPDKLPVVELSAQGHFGRLWQLRREIKQYNPDVLISFEYYVNLVTIVASLGFGKKIIVSERNNPAVIGAGTIKTPLRNFLYRFCDTLVCQTPEAKAFFPKNIQDKTVIIPNPISPHLPEPYNGPRKPVVVTFCRLHKQKNLPLLIEAFEKFHQQFPQYTLEIYGDGPEKEHLQAQIHALNAKEYIRLYPARADVHAPILQSAMFVSSSDFEGLSNSMLEAMAIGLPTICTDCTGGGARMMIQDGYNGLLVPCKDAPALAKAMAKLAHNPEFARQLGKKSAELVHQLDSPKICMRWEKLLKHPQEDL